MDQVEKLVSQRVKETIEFGAVLLQEFNTDWCIVFADEEGNRAYNGDNQLVNQDELGYVPFMSTYDGDTGWFGCIASMWMDRIG